MIETAESREDAEARADVAARNAAEAETVVDEGAAEGEPMVARDPEDLAAERAARDGGHSFEDQGRNELAASIADRRKARKDNPDGEDDDADVDNPDRPDAGEAPGDPPTLQAEPARRAPAARKINFADLDPEAVIVIKVNGRDMEVAAGDLVGNARQYFAGEDHLAKAKGILADVQRTRQAPPPSNTDAAPNRQSQPDRRDGNGATDPSQTKVLDRKKLAAIAGKLQVGTEEEAADALSELAGLVAPQTTAPSQGDVRQQVQDVIADLGQRQGMQGELNQALRSIVERHPALNEERYSRFAPTLFSDGLNLAVQALRDIGVPETDITGQPGQHLLAEYARLRQDPQWRGKLPSIADHFDKAAVDLEQSLGIKATTQPRQPERQPGSQPVIRLREVEKRTITQQPRPAAIRSEAGARDATPKRDNSVTIARMRESREGGVSLQR